jgi:hypothetical protein
MNFVLENTPSVSYFTDVAATLAAMGATPAAFDWYVSDVETNVAVPQLQQGDTWLTGEELASILSGRQVQFIWGVLSAVPKGTRETVVVAPCADGNSTFWRAPEVRPQLGCAVFEVVCWDSSATILVGLSQEQAAHFVASYPDARPLSSTWGGSE